MKSRYFSNANDFARNNFSNYSGGWSNIAPNHFSNADAMIGQGVGQSEPYNFNVSNTTAAAITGVQILGAFDNTVAGVNNFGNVAGITITMDNGGSGYAGFLESIKASPFMVGQIYLTSDNNAQVLKSIYVNYKEAQGKETKLPLFPKLDPSQNLANVIILRTEFPVDGYTKITTDVLANATLQMSLYPKVTTGIANTLVGSSAQKMHAAPHLSQLILPRG